MNHLLNQATSELASFLTLHLPRLSSNWWQDFVDSKLSFNQRQFVQWQGANSLYQLDFAALLRVIDLGWWEISKCCFFPRETRCWVKELQSVRNRWARPSAQPIVPSDFYRDADTLGRFIAVLNPDSELLRAIESVKARSILAMANDVTRSSTDAS
ncbi:MAG: Swt1 family HEPN domain-containing protein [Pirellulaceae bacterium]|nr:Swt1 family HEPN domain-containing protein [Pirellulaceae bacterium]